MLYCNPNTGTAAKRYERRARPVPLSKELHG